MITYFSHDCVELETNTKIERPSWVSPSRWLATWELYRRASEYKKELEDLREQIEFIKQEEYDKGYKDGVEDSVK